ncbi:MAG: DNA mismatch repair endonuclease MutL [Candidatus Marinimicrobia bacterium]|nr:DNA mismatch repair endonuclease MutL [Candidatus Neomarinimicrobiota bacterium]
MSKIKILSDQLTNKIAAGEVVQRPASIVKELVENSLDAGASEITIVIKSGGKSLCQVIDNGDGMGKDDLLLAFERYATSKIATSEDLMAIRTLGFRGEALASIAAVAIVNAISTEKIAESGFELRIEGGSFREIKPIAAIPGTNISIKNLFFNIPARRKFLKSSDVEFRHIIEIVRKFSMIHPQVQFTLIHNDKDVFRLRPEKQIDRIVNLYSSEYRNNLIRVDEARTGMTLSGYIGNLNLVRARHGDQYLFVNKRFISDRLMNHAIASAYSNLISRGEYPFYCLHLELDPAAVDVNVHPTKMEVKFQEQNTVYRFLEDSVKSGLKEIMDVIPDLTRFAPEHYYAPLPVDRMRPSDPEKASPGNDMIEAQFSSGNRDFQSFPQTDPENQTEIPLHFSQRRPGGQWTERARRFVEQGLPESRVDYRTDVPLYQLHNKYIITQVKSGLVIIDQHVAHERILYDNAMKAMSEQPWKGQQLLFPQIVELSVMEFSMLLDVIPFLEKIGFSLREFGKNTIALEAVPAGMAWGNESTIIKEILDHYHEFGTKDTSIQSKVAASYSCKAAIKSGDKLTEEEMHNLVDNLFATQNPYFCPHGRPIIINLTLKELDKRFERV